MKAFRISRAPAAAADAAFDPFAKLVFEPALESDELFDALRESYPALKTHTERKKQAVLDFLMEERQAIEQEITAFVQHTGTPAPQPDAYSSAGPSPVFSASSSLDLRKQSTSNSSSSSSTRSAASSPETLSLKDMTSVWTAAGHGKPKIHTRRSMTTREKEEYRRRRQMKACKECRSRKRKCNHDPSNASSAASSCTGSKVKKRSSTATNPSHPPPSQQTFLSNDFDSTPFLADSTFSTSDSPLDFLDFSPPTGTEESFDDFLLLPQDDFSSIDFNADPLFQPFSYDPFIEPQQSQQHYAPSTGSRSPASTYQSSGMSRSGSNSNALDASQSWNFSLDPMVTVSGGRVLDATFSSALTDGKQSGLAAGLPPNSTSSQTSQKSPAQPSAAGWPSRSLDDGMSTSMSGSPLTSPHLGVDIPSPFLLPEEVTRQAPSAARIPQGSSQPTTHRVTATHTLNAHTAPGLSQDGGVIPHAAPDWFNDGQQDNSRRDGLVLGTDPSAGSRFGEHGCSLARRAPRTSGTVDTAQDQVLLHSGGDGLLTARASMDQQCHGTEVPLSSRNPSAAHSSDLTGHASSNVVRGSGPTLPPIMKSQFTTTTRHTVLDGAGQVGRPRLASALADGGVPSSSGSRAGRSRDVEGLQQNNLLNKVDVPVPNGGESDSSPSLATVHTGHHSRPEPVGVNTETGQRASHAVDSTVSAVLVSIASIFSASVQKTILSLLYLASASRKQAESSATIREKSMGSRDASSATKEIIISAPTQVGKRIQAESKLMRACKTSQFSSSLLRGVRGSTVLV